jgi:hypothetical protein
VTFRVWAPDAGSVFVEGDFNNWSTTANPLGADGNGNWSNDVAGAAVGQTYRYVITSPGFPTVNRRDPYSRVETEANYTAGNSIIYDTSAYQWKSGPFTAAPLKTLMIYEMDIGTYVGVKASTGTFQSAISRLSNISGLGFNAVEVLPVIENPPEQIGYEPTDQLSVDNEEYGGPDNFKAFVDACHSAGGHSRHRPQPLGTLGPGDQSIRRLAYHRVSRRHLLLRFGGLELPIRPAPEFLESHGRAVYRRLPYHVDQRISGRRLPLGFGLEHLQHG